MSLFSSFIIDPVVRQARRFSGATPPTVPVGRPLSHANPSSSSSPPAEAAPILPDEGEAAGDVALDDGLPYTLPPSRSRAATVDVEAGARRDHGERGHDASPSLSRRDTAPSSTVSMSSNPSHSLETALTNPQSARGQNASTMSESLPADDGMRHLRARMHLIRDLTVPDVDKARMMHGLMTEQYNCLRPTSPSSFISHDRPFTPTSGQSVFSDFHVSSPVSAASETDPENPYNLRPGDAEPTYRTWPTNHVPDTDAATEDEDVENFEDVASLGCQHYKRNVKVQCYECRRWYTCRHCHDAVEDHSLNRVKTQNMLCMGCGTPQKAAEYCVQCGMQAACYYCEVCKLWDNNSNKKIYHCLDCGICRRGAGLGKDYMHCKVQLPFCPVDVILTPSRTAMYAYP
jgi:uncharacterized CHY-type Zn-finger protein